jgi:hypothetical protein
MGTSNSQPSPDNSNWRRTFACYSDPNIPEERTINEVWRASENEDIPISEFLKSNTIFECYQIVKNSKGYNEALSKVNEKVLALGNNTIIAEFAKRVIPVAFQSENPAFEWQSLLFSEITNYVVSRDASGFVGSKYRNKSIAQLIEFKRNLSNKVKNVINNKVRDITSYKDWKSFINDSILTLKS